jgi:hypothetical protein
MTDRIALRDKLTCPIDIILQILSPLDLPLFPALAIEIGSCEGDGFPRE